MAEAEAAAAALPCGDDPNAPVAPTMELADSLRRVL